MERGLSRQFSAWMLLAAATAMFVQIGLDPTHAGFAILLWIIASTLLVALTTGVSG